MVCKDIKAAVLLDVAEDFRDKYIQAAQELSLNWLIAALNILNDASLSYKQSRNKRLSVEISLIKLCYLKQAMQFNSEETGSVTKKKLLDAVKPVAFKNISFTKLPQHVSDSLPHQKPKPAAASLIIEKEREKNIQKIEKIPETVIVKSAGFGSLEKIRAKVLEESNRNIPIVQLNEENLQKAWKLFTAKLVTEKKHPAVTQFKAAVLRIEDESNFTIFTEGKLQQRFIETERSGLIEFLHNYFSNKFIKYSMEILQTETAVADENKTLSAKQQYQFMIAKYPLIKELKDRLKLELDY